MSPEFDATTLAIREAHFAQQDAKSGNGLAGRLIDIEWHDDLLDVFGKLKGMPKVHKHKNPSLTIGPVTVYVYSMAGANNLEPNGARDSAIRYEFPDGATVTKIRSNNRLTFRLDDKTGKQVHIVRVSAKRRDPAHWRVEHAYGFKAKSGHVGRHRSMGRGPDKSID